MNRITRMLTITGLGVFAGVTIGAGPAMAATNTGQNAAKPATAGATVRLGDRPAGYYDTRFECNIAGRIGERLGRWDDWNCYPVGGGWHRGDWVLVADYNWDDNGPFDHDNHHGGFPWDHHGHHGHHGGPILQQHDGMKGGMKNNVGMPSAKPNTD